MSLTAIPVIVWLGYYLFLLAGIQVVGIMRKRKEGIVVVEEKIQA